MWKVRVLIASLAGIATWALCNGAPPDKRIAQARSHKTLLLKGSQSMHYPMLAAAKEYAVTHSRVVLVEPTSSTDGLKYAREGGIGMVSRELTRGELREGLVAHRVGTDGIVAVVAMKNPIEKLTTDELKSVLTGNATDWSAVKGLPGAIAIIAMPFGNGTTDTLDHLFTLREKPLAHWHFDDSQRSIVSWVARSPTALGFVTLNQLDILNRSLRTPTRPLAIDGVPPTLATITAGQYPLTRDFYLVTKGIPSADQQRFIDFIVSDPGQTVLSEHVAPLAKHDMTAH